MDFYRFVSEFSVIWPIFVIGCPFFNKMASEKKPRFFANRSDTNLTRRRRTSHPEAPEESPLARLTVYVFHFSKKKEAEDETFKLSRPQPHHAQG